jgi:hypothetical protein
MLLENRAGPLAPGTAAADAPADQVESAQRVRERGPGELRAVVGGRALELPSRRL